MLKGIRPTQDKVRKALFDILGDIQGLLFLELFAGSGAVGLEALSQGASRVVFVENDSRCIKIIKKNLGMLDRKQGFRIQDQVAILQVDVPLAVKQLAGTERFDIVFLDPPYYKEVVPRGRKNNIAGRSASKATVGEALFPRLRSGSKATVGEALSKKTLKSLSHYDIVSPNGLIICQHFKKDILPEAIDNLRLIKQARYGDTILSFYKKEL